MSAIAHALSNARGLRGEAFPQEWAECPNGGGWKAEIDVDEFYECPDTYSVSNRRAFFLGAIIGAYVGVSLLMAVTLWREPPSSSELWTFPVLILGYGTFALPFVILGLAIFGLPAAYLLRGRAREWWVGGIALLWGALAGKLMFYAIDHLLFFGLYDLDEVSIRDMGIIWGVPTALAWWALHRRTIPSA